jgi:fructosamine-3-kinase
VAGGDINRAHHCQLADGRSVFVKESPEAPAGSFEAEAHGLGWLGRAAALRVPAVLAVSAADEPPFLVLEHLAPGRPLADFDERLGRGLSALHRAGAPSHGLERDNFIGRLPQDNRALPDWSSFYRDRRLGPQLALAERAGLATPRLRRGLERVLSRLDSLVGDAEAPARLHGDLWSGNLLADAAGGPALVDPAAYGGHREMDLAMMRLFGGFSERVFDAYAEAWPPLPGARERVPLYQLYPLLVHVNHFGGHYVAQTEALLGRIA